MRALIQRVREASVTVEGQRIAQIGPGILALVCAMRGDTRANADAMAAKLAKLRIFPDPAGKMNLDLRQTGGAALVVSQFTLAGDTSRGNRPGFSSAAPPQDGAALCDAVAAGLNGMGISVQTGQFGADMDVALINEGPVTLWIET
ncbi:MAG: D-aminoacyl-tRNA deacylase [Rhodobacteraceae bacterium]|nr:D-aminoacyl-tRNA deacylase [Paracoccaceae bacterium]